MNGYTVPLLGLAILAGCGSAAPGEAGARRPSAVVPSSQSRTSALPAASVSLNCWDAGACVTDALGRGACWGSRAFLTRDGSFRSLFDGPTLVASLHPGQVLRVESGAAIAWSPGDRSFSCDERNLRCIGLDTLLRGARDVRIGYDVACALSDDAMQCCALSLGPLTPSGPPTIAIGRAFERVSSAWIEMGLRPADAFGIGQDGGCAVVSETAVRCVGTSHDVTSHTRAGLFSTERPIVQIAVAATHACVLTDERAVWCWGGNGARQIMPRSAESIVREPQRVAELEGSERLYLSGAHSCGVRGTMLTCIGDHGDAAHARDLTAAVPWIAEATDICVGEEFTCARSRDGCAECAGYVETGLRAAPGRTVLASCDR